MTHVIIQLLDNLLNWMNAHSVMVVRNEAGAENDMLYTPTTEN